MRKTSAFSKNGGLESKGDFEQRTSGWNSAGNKAVCFERGRTQIISRHNAQYESERKKIGYKMEKPEKGRKGKEKEGKVSYVCGSRRRNGPKK